MSKLVVNNNHTSKEAVLEAGEGYLSKGTILGQVSQTDEWKKYNRENTDGSEIPRAILGESVRLERNNNSATIYTKGEFNRAAMPAVPTEKEEKQLREAGIIIRTGFVEGL